jgi:PAS domain S-box-containing protein
MTSMTNSKPHSHAELDGEYVVYVDASRRYIAVSDGACRLLGYSREQLLGKTIEDITPPEARHEVADQFREYVNYSVQSGEYILLAADGRRIPIHYTSMIFKDGCMGARWQPVPRLESEQDPYSRKAS